MNLRYSTDLDGVPYVHTPNVPRFPIGPAGTYAEANARIAQHKQRVADGTLDWRVDWPDRLIVKLKRGDTYVWRRVRIDPFTGKRGKPTVHTTKKEALE